jgi:hypothetical protein
VTASDATPFLGDWTLAMDGPNGSATFALSVRVEKDQVVGELSSDTQPRQPITEVPRGAQAWSSIIKAHGRGEAPAQTVQIAQANGSSVTPAQAALFVGDWTVMTTSQMGPATFAVSVKVDSGKVQATVSSDAQPAVNVTDISLVAKSLVLKYFIDYQARQFPP